MKVARAKQRIAYTPSRWDIAAIVLLVGGLLSPAITLVVWKIFHLPGGMAFFTATGFVAHAVAVATLRLLIFAEGEWCVLAHIRAWIPERIARMEGWSICAFILPSADLWRIAGTSYN
ncbi:MAG TPA: hypothetical protein VEK74_13650 [Burkholderiaceae bacterium]|nr:hypothetical protein [Burkholderiaceae bacterium]